jgi:hypothetical protein
MDAFRSHSEPSVVLPLLCSAALVGTVFAAEVARFAYEQTPG